MGLRRIGAWGLIMIGVMLVMIGPNMIALLYVNLGNVHVLQAAFNTGQEALLPRAQEFFDRAEQYGASLPRLQYWRGQAYSLAGQPEQALAAWRACPDADYWLTRRGKTELARGQVEAAWSLLETAALLNPNSSTIRYYGGVALQRMGRHSEALAWFSEALALDRFDQRFMLDQNVGDVWWPDRPDSLTRGATAVMTHIQMSAVHCQLRQWDLMRDVAQAAVDSAPEELLGYFQLGKACFMLGNLHPEHEAEYNELAAEAFLTVADQVSDSQFPFFLYLARVHWAQGNVPAATAAYNRVAKVSPFLINQREVIRFYADTGQAQALVPLYDGVLSRTPRRPQSAHRWIAAAEAYWAAGMRDEACALFKTGLDVCDGPDCDVQGSPLPAACADQGQS